MARPTVTLCALLVLAVYPALAQCPQPLAVVRTPVDVAQLLEANRITPAAAQRLESLAMQRQGVAARLLELQYTVGKNASSVGEDDLEETVVRLRERVSGSRDQLAFLDAEIAGILTRTTSMCEDAQPGNGKRRDGLYREDGAAAQD